MNEPNPAKRLFDRAAQLIMVSGAVMLLQPWWREGFRFGFFVAATGTILHLVTSHWRLEERD